MKESGIGRENGIEAFESCESQNRCVLSVYSHHADSQSKSTIVNIAPVEETRANDDWFAEEAEGLRYG